MRHYGLFAPAVNWKVFGTKNSVLDFFRILCIAALDLLVKTPLHLVKIHCLQLVLWYPCLKNQQKGVKGFLLLEINWKVFGTKNSALDFKRILYIAALDSISNSPMQQSIGCKKKSKKLFLVPKTFQFAERKITYNAIV